MFSYEVKFLTNDEALYVKSDDLQSFKYDSKKRNDETIYEASKKSFFVRRGSYNNISTRQVRQLEMKLRDRNIIACKWSCENFVTLVFGTGVIAYISVKSASLDVTQILFDKYCVGKLAGQIITGVVLCKSAILFTFTERSATLITFGKNVDSTKPYLISEREPQIQVLELGGSVRRIDRHVSACEHNNNVNFLVWGSATSEPAPWSPVTEDHANLHLYKISGQQVTLLAYHQLENDVIFAELSQKYDNVVHVVEQIACYKNGVTVVWLRYDVPDGNGRTVKLSATTQSASRVGVPAPVRVARLSPCETSLLVACIDGSIHVVHQAVGITQSTRAGFIATDVRWTGDILLATEENGKLQCFDRALSLLHQHTKCLDLTSYLRDSKRIQILATHRTRSGPIVLAAFAGGPIALLRITHPRLITAWLRSGRVANAVALLQALDWEADSTECLRSIDEVVRSALRREGGEALAQAALGAYLAPATPLPRAAHAHAGAVHDRARTFFHRLLRRGHVETALSLGVELRAWDLFADARWAAARRGLPELAREASEHARFFIEDSECSESCSQCSSHSCSESENESSTSSRAVATNPPPLPRLPVQLQPSILTVPIIPHESHSTTASIRPNLHQYLERENTIWNKNTRDDSYINKTYNTNLVKPIQAQNLRWNSMENVLSVRSRPRNPDQDVVRVKQDDRNPYKHIFQTELKEPQNKEHTTQQGNPNFNGRYRPDVPKWSVLKPEREKNKVKFSETVTVNVVPSPSSPGADVAQELADSLPLCAPHKYLAAFTPAPAAPDNATSFPPKIKVVHFGMV